MPRGSTSIPMDNSITIISAENLGNQLYDVEYSLTLLYNEDVLTDLKGIIPEWSQSGNGLVLDYLQFNRNHSSRTFFQNIADIEIIPNICTCADGDAKSGDDCDPSLDKDQCYIVCRDNLQAENFDAYRHVNPEGECVANVCSCPGGFTVHPLACQSFPDRKDGTNKIIGGNFDPIKCMAAKSLKFQSTFTKYTWDADYFDPNSPGYARLKLELLSDIEDELTYPNPIKRISPAMKIKPNSTTIVSVSASVNQFVDAEFHLTLLYYEPLLTDLQKDTVWSQSGDGLLMDYLRFLRDPHLPGMPQNLILQNTALFQILPNICFCAGGKAASGNDCDPSKDKNTCIFCQNPQSTLASNFDQLKHVNTEGDCVSNVCSCTAGYVVDQTQCQTDPIINQTTSAYSGSTFTPEKCLSAKSLKLTSVTTEPWNADYNDVNSQAYANLTTRLVTEIKAKLADPSGTTSVKDNSIEIISVSPQNNSNPPQGRKKRSNQSVAAQYKVTVLYNEDHLKKLQDTNQISNQSPPLASYLQSGMGPRNAQIVGPIEEIPNICTCTDGTALSGNDCDPSKSEDQCSVCNPGFVIRDVVITPSFTAKLCIDPTKCQDFYHIDLNWNSATYGQCMPNVCKCVDDSGQQIGIPLAECEVHDKNSCASCNDYYHLYALEVGQKCEPNICTCENGIRVDDSKCREHYENQCERCTTPNYHIDKTTQACLPNICTCPGGTVVDNADCETHEAISCVSGSCDTVYYEEIISQVTNFIECHFYECNCPNGFAKPEGSCLGPGTGQCIACDGIYRAVDMSSWSDNVTESESPNEALGFTCQLPSCTCEFGEAVEDSECTIQQGNSCKSCIDLYHLELNYDTGAKECVENSCTCSGGVPIPNWECETADENICSSCDSSHNFNETLKICTPKVCKCTGGTPVNDDRCVDETKDTCAFCDNQRNRDTHVDDTGACVKNICNCPEGTVLPPDQCVSQPKGTSTKVTGVDFDPYQCYDAKSLKLESSTDEPWNSVYSNYVFTSSRLREVRTNSIALEALKERLIYKITDSLADSNAYVLVKNSSIDIKSIKEITDSKVGVEYTVTMLYNAEATKDNLLKYLKKNFKTVLLSQAQEIPNICTCENGTPKYGIECDPSKNGDQCDSCDENYSVVFNRISAQWSTKICTYIPPRNNVQVPETNVKTSSNNLTVSILLMISSIILSF